MIEYSRRIAWAVVVSLIVIILPSLSGAQTVWPSRENRTAFRIESYRMSLTDDSLFSSWASVAFLSAKFSVSHTIAFVGEVPAAYSGFTGMAQTIYDRERWIPGEDKTKFGNAYFGIELTPKDSDFTAELGFRGPTMSPSMPFTQAVGVMATIDRWGAFVRNSLSISAMLGRSRTSESGLVYQLRGGVIHQWIGSTQEPAELQFRYGARGGYRKHEYLFMLGLQGLYWATAESDAGEPGLMNILEALFSIDKGVIQPGFRLLLPFSGDLSDVFKVMYGLDVSFVIE